MRKRKGFTLVELLAVIVILAVILVIAVPKILNVIDNARRGAFENSVNLIVSSAKNYYARSMLDGGINDEIVFTQNNGELVNGENKLEFSGMEVAGESYLKLNSAGSVALSITDGVYYASKEFDEVGIVVTEEEGSALTREELSARLSELEARVDNQWTEIYPVGSIYTSVNNTNPSTIYGGTWVSFGSGKTIVGVDSSDDNFNAVEKTGGEKTHILTVDEMPSHNHPFETTSTTKELIGSVSLQTLTITPTYDKIITGVSGVFDPLDGYASGYGIANTSYRSNIANVIRSFKFDGVHEHSGNTNNVGNSEGHNNLQPYITVYMWKRTA